MANMSGSVGAALMTPLTGKFKLKGTACEQILTILAYKNRYDDWQNWLQKNRNHPKIYFGKWHHSAHIDWHDNSFKDTCPPDSANDFRNADYQFWALNNLRHTSVLHGDWNWGKATAPNYIDVCSY
jgi:hypothetical protein